MEASLEAALRAVEDSAGLHGEVDGDGVTLSWEGRARRFRVERRAFLRAWHVPLLQGRAEGALVVTRHVGPPLADLLRRAGVAFVDEAGNTWVRTPDWAVFVSGRSPAAQRAARPEGSRTTWQVAYVLLRGAAGACAVRELAARAGVSHGTAGNALLEFERRGWITRTRGRSALRDPEGMLAAWEFGYVDRLRGAIDMGFAAIPSGTGVAAWGERVRERLGPEHGVLGGALAAQWMGADVAAETATLHLREWDRETIRALAAVPAERGPIAVRRVFGPCTASPERPDLADPLLVYAELLGVDAPGLDGARAALRERIAARWGG